MVALHEETGADFKTIRRWQAEYRREFEAGRYRLLRGRFGNGLGFSTEVAELFSHFLTTQNDSESGVVRLLQFVAENEHLHPGNAKSPQKMLLSSPPGSGETGKRLRSLAAQTWMHPETGVPVRFGFSTIEQWYYRARQSDNPIAALTTLPRKDSGENKAMSPALLSKLERQYQLHPRWSYDLHHQNLAVIAGRDEQKYGAMPSYATLRRRMRALGWTKKRRPKNATSGQVQSFERRENREVRSYERSHVGALWHLDFHHARRAVTGQNGQWFVPVCFAAMDDFSRLCLHAQWYDVENTDNLVHGFTQALAKRGLPRALMNDRGSAMMSEEFTNGLRDLSITHKPTLPYSPYQNAKQESFWGTLEGQLMSMLESKDDITLQELNLYTQAWVEQGYNNNYHEEIKCTPVERFMTGPSVLRASVDMRTMRLAFSARVNRRQRKSDGTITLDGVRFEIPNHLRTLDNVTIRYQHWNLSSAAVVDNRTGAELATIRPIDKQKNANGMRRPLKDSGAANYPVEIKQSEQVAPLLQQMLSDYSATGLPPAYLPKTESLSTNQNRGQRDPITEETDVTK